VTSDPDIQAAREKQIEDLVHYLGSMATYEARNDFESRAFAYQKSCEILGELLKP
jgi:hypothetical protein